MTSDAARIADLEAQIARLTEQNAIVRAELEALSYAVSHDLRAPLRSLSGFSQALTELPSGTLDEKALHYLNRIQQASRKMSELIDALLSLSRVSRADLQIRAVDLTQLCREAAQSVAARYPDRTVTVQIAPDMRGLGDARLLRTALELLFDNAYKFTAPRSDAQIDVSISDGTLSIRDNGVGFDMAYAEKLFRPFQRLHADPQFSGIGIGLATVQRIVARHGGKVWAKSTPNEGATIFLSLPNAVTAGS